VKVTTKEHIMDLVNSETRIILLYTTKVSSTNQNQLRINDLYPQHM
jgi:hypothetical protein